MTARLGRFPTLGAVVGLVDALGGRRRLVRRVLHAPEGVAAAPEDGPPGAPSSRRPPGALSALTPECRPEQRRVPLRPPGDRSHLRLPA